MAEVDGKQYVLVVENASNTGYSFVRKEVKTGVSNNDYIEIVNVSDFKENTEFLIKGAFNLIKD